MHASELCGVCKQLVCVSLTVSSLNPVLVGMENDTIEIMCSLNQPPVTPGELVSCCNVSVSAWFLYHTAINKMEVVAVVQCWKCGLTAHSSNAVSVDQV